MCSSDLGPSATLQPLPQPARATTPPVVRLTLDEAVKFALDRNLDIAVQRLNPEIQDIAYASAQSVYHPALTSQLAGANRVSQLLPPLQPSSKKPGMPVP